MNCEQLDDLLLEYVEGELDDDRRSAVSAHLDACAACQGRLRSMRAIFGDLSAARSVDNRARRPEALPDRAALGAGHRGLTRLGDFEIRSELGRGGMGVVYEARQISLGRVVALKVLASGALQSERAIARFQHEAQAAARLHHTNIVPVYAQGTADGQYFYAMELIEGESLSAIIRADASAAPTVPAAQRNAPAAHNGEAGYARSVSPTVSQTRATESLVRTARTTPKYRRLARLFAEVADALHHAHVNGVVHRDIKPQNLLLGGDDKLHVTDFGLARLLDEPGMTRTHEMVGTPAYMAPEQIAPERGAIDGRTDVYALGVTLYEALTLGRPFEGATYDQIIHRILETEPTRPRRIDRNIPRDLETICLRAMEKSPAARFPSAAAMAADLQRYATDYPIASRPISPLGRAWRWVKRNQAKTAAAAALTLVALLTPILVGFIRVRDARLIETAHNALLDNYLEPSAALAELGRVSWLTGKSRDWKVAQALAHVSGDANISCSILQPVVSTNPNDLEAAYLLAWAEMRAARTGNSDLGDQARALMQRTDEIRKGGAARASGAAHFFRGQALVTHNLEDALQAFRDAMAEHPRSFPAAMLHRARAINQLLYVRRDDQYFSEAESTLKQLQSLRPKDPYVLYLLATSYQLRSEILAAEVEAATTRGDERLSNLTTELERARAAGDEYATRARAEHPLSPYGYMAAAWLAESRRDYRSAIDHWNAMPLEAREKSVSSRRDRAVYLMRLYFWVGETEKALQMQRDRYKDVKDNDPDAFIWDALFTRSLGDAASAEQTLRAGAAKFTQTGELAMRLGLGFELCGFQPPPAVFAARNQNDHWTDTLRGYCRGEVTWDALITAIGDPPREERTLRMARATFHRGVRELQTGDRAAAEVWFRRAGNHFDYEGYCFRGRMLAEKLRLDPTWPTWIPQRSENNRPEEDQKKGISSQPTSSID